MEKTGGSRLLQMQARFQQKQMQEREMKIASLYEAQQARALDRVRHSPSNIGAAASPPHREAPAAHQPGKVRQMFEERRTKAGIDKSYPLQPIHNTDKAATRKPLPNGYSKVTTGAKLSVERKTSKMYISSTTHNGKKKQHKIENLVNGSGDLNHNHERDLHPVKQKMPQCNGELIHTNGTDEMDRPTNNYMIEQETFPEALAPSPTPRSPDPPVEAKKPLPRRGPANRISPAKTKPPPTATSPTPRTNEIIASDNNKARGVMQKTAPAVLSKKLSVSGSNNGGVESARSAKARQAGAGGSSGAGAGSGEPCAICGRRFAAERLDKHQDICRKSHAKKRKPFDALKHRLAGTEAEPFISKLRKASNTPSTTKAKPLNSTWRKKHEEFINAIRAAKQVQAHLDAGGKLSDLPPPPPSENPDYVSCPHCGRRFNQAAAERHIPKCASFQFNKPKPGPKRR